MNLEEKLTNVVEDGSSLPFAVEEESHHLNVCWNPVAICLRVVTQ